MEHPVQFIWGADKEWDWNQLLQPASFTPSVHTTPLLQWIIPVTGIALYLVLFVILRWLIPQGKSPLVDSPLIKAYALTHNIFLCLLSLFMGITAPLAAYQRATTHPAGAFSLVCGQESGPALLHGWLGYLLYIYYVSKYIEMIDTIILLLRGKPVIFLHLYHHAVMVGLSWSWIYFGWLEGSWWCVFVNSWIHVLMYSYYALTVVGKTIWWKKWLTSAQIVQFITGIIYVTFYLYYYFALGSQLDTTGEWQPGCGGNLRTALAAHAVNISFLLLFISFFKKEYSDRNANERRKKAAKTD